MSTDIWLRIPFYDYESIVEHIGDERPNFVPAEATSSAPRTRKGDALPVQAGREKDELSNGSNDEIEIGFVSPVTLHRQHDDVAIRARPVPPRE